jgi:UDPglucose 6-dehydrogenase
VKICVIGTGYVGLVTGVVFSDLGNDVICVDNDREKIEMLKKNRIPIYEPGLEEMVRINVAEERLSFSTDIGHGVKESEIVFIAVGTPPAQNGRGKTDLSYVEAVAEEIARHINGYKIIVNKSTVPVGTGDLVEGILEKHGLTREKDFDVASNPEFLKEGTAISDSMNPDRVVVGAPNKMVAEKLRELYASLECPVIKTDVRSAEIIKYASNSFLATKISFINAIANLCEKAGADVSAVMQGMGTDKRIGKEFLQAGLGYGGSCFPKDVDSLIYTATEVYNEDFGLLEHVVQINEERVLRFISRLEKILGGFSGTTIGILGLAFKPNTDDMREAKSMEIIYQIMEGGAQVRAFDPQATENAKKELSLYLEQLGPERRAKIDLSRITYCTNPYETAKDTDALVLVTEWREFKLLDMARIKNLMKRPIFFDGRNMYDPEKQKAKGFEYYSIGRS